MMLQLEVFPQNTAERTMSVVVLLFALVVVVSSRVTVRAQEGPKKG